MQAEAWKLPEGVPERVSSDTDLHVLRASLRHLRCINGPHYPHSSARGLPGPPGLQAPCSFVVTPVATAAGGAGGVGDPGSVSRARQHAITTSLRETVSTVARIQALRFAKGQHG